MKKLLAASIVAISSFALGANAMADIIVNYTLSGAIFDNFTDGSGAETLSGTWTVDYTTGNVIALALYATGPEDLSFDNRDDVGGEPYFSGTPGVDVQYEIEVNADQLVEFG